MNKEKEDSNLDYHSFFVALYLSQKLKSKTFEAIIASFEDEKIQSVIQNVYEEETKLIEELNQLPLLSEKEWLDIVFKTPLFDYGNTKIEKTPISIIKLANKLLEIKKQDSILDIGSGLGVTLAYLSMQNDIKLMGIEIVLQEYIYSKLLLDAMNKDTSNVIFGNVYQTDLTTFKSNKIFINGPLGLRVSKDIYNEVIDKKFKGTTYEKLIPKLDGAWLFVLDAVLHSNFEKIVVVLNEAPLVNNRDIYIRKQLLKDGLVEAVIDLPEGLLDYSNVAVSMLVLSKNNKKVTFVDATKLGTKNRRQTELIDDDIEIIINALEKDGKISKTCEFKEIENEDFIFSSKRYLMPDLPFENTVQLKDVVKSINRGAMVSSKNLEELKSEDPTPYQYLSLNNFTNGLVDKNLPYIHQINSSLEKHVIKKDSLIISKMAPFKVAFIKIEDTQILASGNLYFLEVDESKINRKYLEAYLQSELGMREFLKFEKGTVMKTISISDLEKIKIPLLTEEEQKKIGDKFELLNQEYQVHLENIKRIEEEKKNIMDVRKYTNF